MVMIPLVGFGKTLTVADDSAGKDSTVMFVTVIVALSLQLFLSVTTTL